MRPGSGNRSPTFFVFLTTRSQVTPISPCAGRPRKTLTKLTRRQLIASAAASAVPFPAGAVEMPEGWVPSDDYLPRVVEFRDELLVGAIIVDPDLLHLYHVTAPQSGVLYTVRVRRGDLYEAGTFTVGAKKEWPSWTPAQDMIDCDPDQ